MPENEYKPNSHKYNEAHTSSASDEPAKKKPTVREHKTVGERFKDTFFAESFKSVVDYIIWDVVIPAAKDMILTFVETTLFGRSGNSYSRRDYISRTNYSRSSRREDSQHSVRTRPAKNFGIERFEFESRREAEDILQQMNDYARKYEGVCSVAAFYDFVDCDRPNDWTHDRWGWSWKQLDRARIIRKSTGWFAISMGEPDTYID